MGENFEFDYFMPVVEGSDVDYNKSAAVMDNGTVVASLIMGDQNMGGLNGVNLHGVNGIAMASDSPTLFPRLARYVLRMWDCDYFWGISLRQLGVVDFWKKHAIITQSGNSYIDFVLPISDKAKELLKVKRQ